MKVVINAQYGGFGLSEFAIKKIEEIKGEKISEWDIERTDKDLIYIVEKYKQKCDGFCSTLKIVEIPDDVDWQIDEYDGLESVEEKHRSWQ
jgi:hypothetical protein